MTPANGDHFKNHFTDPQEQKKVIQDTGDVLFTELIAPPLLHPNNLHANMF